MTSLQKKVSTEQSIWKTSGSCCSSPFPLRQLKAFFVEQELSLRDTNYVPVQSIYLTCSFTVLSLLGLGFVLLHYKCFSFTSKETAQWCSARRAACIRLLLRVFLCLLAFLPFLIVFIYLFPWRKFQFYSATTNSCLVFMTFFLHSDSVQILLYLTHFFFPNSYPNFSYLKEVFLFKEMLYRTSNAS